MDRKITFLSIILLLCSCVWAINIEIPVTRGWNLIAVPCTTSYEELTDVFPESSIAYTYNADSRSYEALDSFPRPILGFWLLSDIDTLIAFECFSTDIIYSDTTDTSEVPDTSYVPIMVSGGRNSSYALLDNGHVLSWGDNEFNQLGDNSDVDRLEPVYVLGSGGETILDSIRYISSGHGHVLTVNSEDHAFVWGYNNHGQLGINNRVNQSVPVFVKDSSGTEFLTGIQKVSSGYFHSIILLEDSSLVSFGYNIDGRLGDQTNIEKLLPVRVLMSDSSNVEDVISVSSGQGHNLAITHENRVIAWGKNINGQLGDSTTANKNNAVYVHGIDSEYLENALSISTGGEHSLVLLEDSTLVAFGSNESGRLGTGDSSEYELLPKRVVGESGGYLHDIIAISCGLNHSLALSEDGFVYAWGSNSYGQLGTGDYESSDTPIRVRTPEGDVLLENIKYIATGYFHSLAISSDGKVYCWGRNSDGQLGNGTRENSNLPIEVHLP